MNTPLSPLVHRIFINLISAALLVNVTYGASPTPPSLPAGFTAQVYASEDMLANPVAIDLDSQMRLYVAEAHRKHTGVWGVTFSRWWSMEDYRGRTLADRSAMYERWSHLVPQERLTEKSEIVRVVWDSDLDGIADQSRIYASDFNDPLDGNAAGILALDDRVLLTSIPHLWQLQDRDQDNTAEIRTPLHTGFGVRVGVHGHDLHGLIQGPDGKIYFTVGDRGYDVILGNGNRAHESHRGAVFRCYPDGSALEVFHTGLRNPQELAFNDYGDLFTVDNNMSGGDECRILHLLEGVDSAWDASFQLSGHFRDETHRLEHPKPTWFSERLWSQPFEGQPRWHNPAVGQLSRGPSGLAHYPGTGFPKEFDNTFLLADFVGNPANSGLLKFRLKAKGATYELAESEQFIWGILATDFSFGPDGNLYIADWLNGWTGVGKGQTWKITPPVTDKAEPHTRVQQLLQAPSENLSSSLLTSYLDHVDRRVRYRGQFELARRQASDALVRHVERSGSLLGRIHALWGLAQLADDGVSSSQGERAIALASENPHAEVRAQAAKAIRSYPPSDLLDQRLIILLADNNSRVLYQTILSAAHRQQESAIPHVVELLQSRETEDPALRHAGVVFLAELLNATALAAYHDHPHQQLRECAALALRKKASPLIEAFLNDETQRIRHVAIRAIHDRPIPSLFPRLAALATAEQLADPSLPFPVAHRLLNANFRLGRLADARRLVQIATSSVAPFPLRLEAIDALAQWRQPSDFDRVTWHLQPHYETRIADISTALKPEVVNLFNEWRIRPPTHESDPYRRALRRCTDLLRDFDLLDRATGIAVIESRQLPGDTRLDVLRTAQERGWLTLPLATRLLDDPLPTIGAVAAVSLVTMQEENGWRSLKKMLTDGSPPVMQACLNELNSLPTERTRPILKSLVARMKTRELSREVWLELFRACAPHPELKADLDEFLTSRDQTTKLGTFQVSQQGGDPERGKTIFEYHPAQCHRCHQVNGLGGSAGPDLTHIARSLSRQQLIEALVYPSQRIAPGFGTITVDLKDGETVTGLVVEDTEKNLRLRQPDQSVRAIPSSDIEVKTSPISSMPPMGDVLTLAEMRDLISYLATLK